MSRKINRTHESKHTSAAERYEAFQRGYADNARGVKREKCPFEHGPQVIRAWREGWDKSEKGLVINLPTAS